MRIRLEARGFLWAAWTSANTSASGLFASQAGSNGFLPLFAGLSAEPARRIWYGT